MTTSVNAYAALTTGAPLTPYSISRRQPGPRDVQIQIEYCGVCHSDLHFINGDWGPLRGPTVPGHEIVGRIEAVGAQVSGFRVGQRVGVGCLVNSCRTCSSCRDGLEQYCDTGMVMTYGSPDPVSGGLTQGGYSTKIVVDQDFVVRIPEEIPAHAAAPLLCAGITTYSPLRQWRVERGQKVAVAGLGGLGHMAVKLAAAMGAEVTVLSTSERKRADAARLGAHDFAVVTDAKQAQKIQGRYDLILNTISAKHDYNLYLSFLKRDATMVLLGLPEPEPVNPFILVGRRRRLAGSLIGGLKETQEMLDFCGQHKIAADVEMIEMSQINGAYERMVKGDVRYRFVIDISSLRS